MRGLTSLVLTVGLLTACQSSPETTDSDRSQLDASERVQDQNSKDYDPSDVDIDTLAAQVPSHIRFSQEACFGTCPIFDMLITPADRFYVYPRGHVKRELPYAGELDKGTFAKIQTLANTPKYSGLQSDYRIRSEKCEYVRTDAPSSAFAIQTDTLTREIEVYWGCGTGDSETLRSFFDDVEGLLDLKRTVYRASPQ